jgi:hypothetical protein
MSNFMTKWLAILIVIMGFAFLIALLVGGLVLIARGDVAGGSTLCISGVLLGTAILAGLWEY